MPSGIGINKKAKKILKLKAKITVSIVTKFPLLLNFPIFNSKREPNIKVNQAITG